jgi:hypothetical protein
LSNSDESDLPEKQGVEFLRQLQNQFSFKSISDIGPLFEFFVKLAHFYCKIGPLCDESGPIYNKSGPILQKI